MDRSATCRSKGDLTVIQPTPACLYCNLPVEKKKCAVFVKCFPPECRPLTAFQPDIMLQSAPTSTLPSFTVKKKIKVHLRDVYVNIFHPTKCRKLVAFEPGLMLQSALCLCAGLA